MLVCTYKSLRYWQLERFGRAANLLKLACLEQKNKQRFKFIRNNTDPNCYVIPYWRKLNKAKNIYPMHCCNGTQCKVGWCKQAFSCIAQHFHVVLLMYLQILQIRQNFTNVGWQIFKLIFTQGTKLKREVNSFTNHNINANMIQCQRVCAMLVVYYITKHCM